MDALARHMGVDLYQPWSELPEEIKHDKLLYGIDEEVSFSLDRGEMSHRFKRPWEGFVNNLERLYRETTSQAGREDLQPAT